MRWLNEEFGQALPTVATAELLKKAVETRLGDPNLHLLLGTACYQMQDYPCAATSLEVAARATPGDFARWEMLADTYLALQMPREALEACERASSSGVENAMLRYRRGVALRKLGRTDEAQTEFQRCVELGDDSLRGLRQLLQPLAREGDGGPLLTYCETLPSALQDTALVRSNRAIALSRLGRRAEAIELIDLDRHVARIPIMPPSEFSNAEEFNAMLASELMAIVQKSRRPSSIEIFYDVDTSRGRALPALVPLLHRAFENYLDQWDERRLEPALRTRPSMAKLPIGFTILRGDATNGEHIHSEAYISGVYHVTVPQRVASSKDGHGDLTLGGCERYSAGHRGCWGTRSIRPKEGWLTLFPSHIFHDVIPTGTDEPRIAIAADMRRVD